MSDPFVPIEDVAKHFSVSISTVRSWVRQNHIPKDTYIKIGSTYRFNVGDVSHALTNKKKESEPANKWEQHFEEQRDIIADIDLDDDI
jgi:hypothetical protein|tara:strand:- start:1381 stop:1644 length:264 start_codon:yes stop_codon:yes gene_type:complete